MEEEDQLEAGSLYVVTIEPYLTNQKQPINQTQFDLNHTIEFFKLKLESLMKADLRMQKKLKQMHRLQYQLSLLINKNIDGKYGIPTDNSNTPKSIIPPLPPIEKGALSDLLRIIHSLSPNDLRKYVYQSGIIEQLIFEDSSIFNSRLLESILRTPPDIQVSFIVSIIEQIRLCSEFYNKLISTISQFTLNNSLQNQLTSPNSNLSLFLKFYENSLNHIAEICKADECKIVYCSNEKETLLFPTQKLTYIISTDDSLSGLLLQQSKPTQIEYPRQEKSFEATTEGSLFSNDVPILSVPIKLDQDSTIGILILIKNSSKFSNSDEILLTKVSQYLSPIFQLFRSVFVQINPSQYLQLFQCISSLRNDEKPLFSSIKEQFCTLTSSTFCKLYINGSDITDPELKQLPQDPSLVRKSYETETVISLKNPRSSPDFNKDVDDESSLSKISSILIVPVKNSPIVIVLYNPQHSSEFSSLQKKLASLLSLSLISVKNASESDRLSQENNFDQNGDLQCDDKCAKEDDQSAVNDESTNDPLSGIGELFDKLGSDKFVESVMKFLPSGVELHLYFTVTSDTALEFPSNKVIQFPEKLRDLEEEVHFSAVENGTDFGAKLNDFGFTSDVKCFLVIPSVLTDHKSICTFSSKDAKSLSSENATFCQKIGRLLLHLIEPHALRLVLRSIRERLSLVDGSCHLTASSISPFVGANVECHFFDKPLTEEPRLNRPLSIMVETPRGIEAALTSDAPVKSETCRGAFVCFAELMSAVLTSKKGQINEPSAVYVSFFVEMGVLDVFGCTIFEFSAWMARVIAIYEEGGIDSQKKFASSRFVSKMIVAKKWEGWFSKEEKIVIVLIVFLSEIEKCWRCTVDDQLVDAFNELMCRPVSGLICSILLGKEFGICGKSTSLAQKKLLIKIIDDFAIGKRARDFAEVAAHIKLLSLHSFKLNKNDKAWLGRSLVLISDIHEFGNLNEEMAGQITIETNPIEKNKMIFKLERVFIPMLSLMSQSNEVIETILENVRSSLKILQAQIV